MDPGRTGDRFSFTSIYSPNGGNFYNVYVNTDVFCGPYGAARSSSSFYLCASRDFPDPSNERDGSGTGVYSVSHPDQAGRTLVDGIQLHGTFRPNGRTILDNAGTGVARCRTGTDTRCLY